MPRGKPKTGVPCHTCKVAERLPNSCYCRDCSTAKNRASAFKRALKVDVKADVPKARKDHSACNCRDPHCQGLTCDSLRYGTARSLSPEEIASA